MKKTFTLMALGVLLNFCAKSQNTFPSTGAAGIGTKTPNSSSLLEVKSTTKGILIPRMTIAQRRTIASPALGLLIFQTDATPGFYYYNNGWHAVTPAITGFVKTDLSNLAATTLINSNLLPASSKQKNIGSAYKKWKKGYFGDTVFVKTLIAVDSSSTGVQAYGNYYGVYASSRDNYGVYGAGGYAGLYGSGGTYGAIAYGSSYGVYGSGNYGVYGSGSTYGVYGYSSTFNNSGVYGSGYSAFGVQGNSSGNYGGYFTSNNFHGIYARTSSTDGNIYAAVFQGNTYCYGTYATSDERVKKNIGDVKNAMDLINALKPKKYDFRTDGNYANLNLPRGNHFGFLAQDVEKLFPGLVKEAPLELQAPETAMVQDPTSKMPDTAALKRTPVKIETMQVKAINYTELIPVMVKGMQELDAENKSLKQQVADMQSQMAQLQQALQDLSLKTNSNNAAVSVSDAALQQNVPNPFAVQTTIALNVPANAKQASLIITAAGSGKLLKTITLTPGMKQISLDASLLSGGTYTYTLMVDGKKMESKQMVVAK